MGLPKLNDVPKYRAVVPSTNNEITFRPFLVKEEKILLIGLETQDAMQIASAVMDTVKSCVYEELDMKSLTSYDIEFLFLKIRAKSVGETSKLVFKCKECATENDVRVNIDDINIKVDNSNNKINITDKIIVEMKHPTFSQMAASESLNEKSPTVQVFGLIRESINSVMTDDERIDMRDIEKEEFQEFIESMTQEQFTKIREYIENIPKLSHDIEFDCIKCNTHNEIKVEGLQSFL
tara:strand:+ start:615 stop:1322 length:708 start_codon:yes stop_codon:yes gene_type:complete